MSDTKFKIQNSKFKITFQKSKIISFVLIAAEIAALAVLLYWRLKLGVTRYFDIDEFAHLHWGYSFLTGEKPYTDFFYLFPPFFLYPVAFLIGLFGKTVAILTYARMMMFGVFLLSILVIILLGRTFRNLTTAILAAIIFSFLPLPSDKMLEVRPDLLAVSLSILGIYLFIKGNDTGKKLYYWGSGLVLSASLGFVPKTIFFIVPVWGVFVYRFIRIKKQGEMKKLLSGQILPFIAGVLIPALVLSMAIITSGNQTLAIYSMTQMATRVSTVLGIKFYIRPDMFFHPNDAYYGLPGYSLPYIANLIIYWTAIVWGISNLARSLSHKDDRRCLKEFLIGSAFYLNLYAYVKIYPLRHVQYLVPLAPFISLYFADLVETMGRIRLVKFLRLRTIIIPITLGSVVLAGWQMFEVKKWWGNIITFEKIESIQKTIPPDEPVFDMTGETLFYKNGYYFCCLPYGQYEEAISFPLPNIEREIEKRKTKYVYTGTYDRLNVISAVHAVYIRKNFEKLWSDGSLLVRKEK